MQNIDKQENLSDVYFRVYKLPRMISCYADTLQRLVCKWNHCSIRVGNVVIHFFDDWVIPKWVAYEVDLRAYKNYDEILVGRASLHDLREYTNKLPEVRKIDLLARYMWFYTGGIWPKKNDCVDKCSSTLTFLFNIPRCSSTPDKLFEIIKECNGRSSSIH